MTGSVARRLKVLEAFCCAMLSPDARNVGALHDHRMTSGNAGVTRPAFRRFATGAPSRPYDQGRIAPAGAPPDDIPDRARRTPARIPVVQTRWWSGGWRRTAAVRC